MAYDLDVGGGSTVRIHEPERGNFPENLGGAVEYTLTRFIYSTLEFMGGAMGSWLAGVLVKFLDSVEPALVTYTAPLLDMLLEVEGLPDHLHDFLIQLKTPTDAAGAAVLAGLASSAGGSVAGGVIGSLSTLWTYPLNRSIRGGRPGAGEIANMQWRGAISSGQASEWYKDLGYPDSAIEGYHEIVRPRIDIAGMVSAMLRKKLSRVHLTEELSRRGFTQRDIDLIYETIHRYLPAETIIQAYLRGEKTQQQAREDLSAQGLREHDIEVLFNLSQIIPNVSDLISMAVREAWDEEVAHRWGYDADFPEEFASWAEKVGLSRDWAIRYWRAHWNLPSVSLGFEMMHRNVITPGELEELLRISDYPAGWRNKMMEVSYKPFTRVDTRRMYGLGVLDREGVKRAYLDLGYDEVKAEAMTEFTILYESREGANDVSEYQSISQGLIEDAYRLGTLSQAEATTRLLDLGYTHETSNLILSVVDAKKELASVPDMMPQFRRDMQALVERAYERKVIGPQEGIEMLTDLGYSENEAEYILLAVNAIHHQKAIERRLNIIGKAYVLRAISTTRTYELLGQLNLPSAQQAEVIREWDVEREIRDRRLTESQYRKAYSLDIIDIEEYQESLRGLGYTERDIDILTRMMEKTVGE